MWSRGPREEKGSRVMGGLKGGHADWWGSQHACWEAVSSHITPCPQPWQIHQDHYTEREKERERERETSACLQNIKVTLQLLKCCFPLTFYFSCTWRKTHLLHQWFSQRNTKQPAVISPTLTLYIDMHIPDHHPPTTTTTTTTRVWVVPILFTGHKKSLHNILAWFFSSASHRRNNQRPSSTKPIQILNQILFEKHCRCVNISVGKCSSKKWKGGDFFGGIWLLGEFFFFFFFCRSRFQIKRQTNKQGGCWRGRPGTRGHC